MCTGEADPPPIDHERSSQNRESEHMARHRGEFESLASPFESELLEPEREYFRWTPALIAAALDGDFELCDELMLQLERVIRSRVHERLRRSDGLSEWAQGRCDRDRLSLDVFSQLFEDDGGILRRWKPARGPSLERFVGAIVERHVDRALSRWPAAEHIAIAL
jgi:hypothetical protein